MSLEEKLITIAENQPKIYQNGYGQGEEKGYKQGYEQGYEQGHEQGEEKGYKQGQNEIEIMLTHNYMRTNYNTAFCQTDFSGYTFSQPIRPITAMYMFQNYVGYSLPKNIDFSTILTSEKRISYMFENAQYLDEIDITGMPEMTSYAYAFSRCRNVRTIKGINCADNIGWTYTFNECLSLNAVFFTRKECIHNDINFQDSPITDENSLKNIVDALYNFINDPNRVYTRTITVSELTRQKLKTCKYNSYYTCFDMIENKGWIV